MRYKEKFLNSNNLLGRSCVGKKNSLLKYERNPEWTRKRDCDWIALYTLD